MLKPLLAVIGAAAAISFVVTRIPVEAEPPAGVFASPGGPRLERFASAHAFERYVANVQQISAMYVYDMAPPPVAATGDMPLPGIDAQGEPANPAITNNQTVGVDEGGIIKQIGRYLVVLQDGRLFSADLGAREGAQLRLAGRIDVYRSPDTAANWYDEMLVFGDRILVTAYNYRESATEITVLRLGEDGRFNREGRFLLSSDDYYSTENYATRLVGDNLVFYAPIDIASGAILGDFRWPTLRRADGDGEAVAGEALIGPTDVYAPPGRVEAPVLHTLSICPLRRDMACRTTAFVGPSMREIYVSPTDAFLWIGAPDGLPWSIDYANRGRQACPPGEVPDMDADQSALLYRIPLDGGDIGAVAVDGIPADQFAFESRDGRFRAMLAKAPAGCLPPNTPSGYALLDIPLSSFGSRIRRVAGSAYAALPSPGPGVFENRFVGDWLVYGSRPGAGSMPPGDIDAAVTSALYAVPVARPAEAMRLALPHGTLRIERAGADAVVTGYRDRRGLSISYVSLGSRPRVATSTLLAGRYESENRSHAFNAWIRRDGSGVIGLATSVREWRAERGWSDSERSDLSFVAIGPDKALASAGELTLRQRAGNPAYACAVSCVDWYGNSRPVFTGGRIFALMGTDLVEGRLADDLITEIGRVDLTGAPG